jgi:hypothetical protein
VLSLERKYIFLRAFTKQKFQSVRKERVYFANSAFTSSLTSLPSARNPPA